MTKSLCLYDTRPSVHRPNNVVWEVSSQYSSPFYVHNIAGGTHYYYSSTFRVSVCVPKMCKRAQPPAFTYSAGTSPHKLKNNLRVVYVRVSGYPCPFIEINSTKYMKQLILIIPAMSKKVSVAVIKTQIVSYVGTRLIDTNDNNVPGLLLKQSLSKTDKEHISEFIKENGAIVFIDVDENFDSGENYLSAKAFIDNEEETLYE